MAEELWGLGDSFLSFEFNELSQGDWTQRVLTPRNQIYKTL